MIPRKAAKRLLDFTGKMPVVALTGPRQSGKTTLVRHLFADRPYISLEDLDNRDFAATDPRGFLKTVSSGAVLDEVQRVPELFNYLQSDVDLKGFPGKFILTGSGNLLLDERISQSLAGRVALLELFPFTVSELTDNFISPSDGYESSILKGFYPRIYDTPLDPEDFYPNYIRTYVERDVRQIRNISDLNLFQNFLKLCAGRIGQLVNHSSLGNDCGIDAKTVRAWISVLKAAYVVFELTPWHQNFNKRVLKSPKLYFWDTGLACSLLGIRREEDIKTHYQRGSLFENLVIADALKETRHAAKALAFHYWRENNGAEIDLLLGEGSRQAIVEIKSARTMSPEFFKGLKYYQTLSRVQPERSFLVTGGDLRQDREICRVMPWTAMAEMLEEF